MKLIDHSDYSPSFSRNYSRERLNIELSATKSNENTILRNRRNMRFNRLPNDQIKKLENRYSLQKGIFENPAYKEYLSHIYQQRPSLQAYSSENMKQILDKKYNKRIQFFNSGLQEPESKNTLINQSFDNINNQPRSSPRMERILNYAINRKDSRRINTKTLINERAHISRPANNKIADPFKRNNQFKNNDMNENHLFPTEENPSSPQNEHNLRIQTQNEVSPSQSFSKRYILFRLSPIANSVHNSMDQLRNRIIELSLESKKLRNQNYSQFCQKKISHNINQTDLFVK